MIKNYFKVAFRNIMKHKFFSAINILGMTIGVTACLFLILYIADELSYDQFHQDADRMYQVGLHGKIAGQDIRTASTCPPLYRAMAEEIPDVEETTRLANNSGQVVKYEDKAFTQDKIFCADSNFFSFFSFELIKGDPTTALKEPNSVVITQAMATKYFGNEEPMGKIISMGEFKAVKVTGIAAESPSNSHVHFDMLLSSVTREDLRSERWLNNYLYTYYKLQPKGSLANVEAQLKQMVTKYVGPEVEQMMGINMAQMEEQGGEYGYFNTKLTDIHLRSEARDSIEPAGNITYVYSFGAIALLIIVIACINFMNLSTARSSGRAKEVGLRKTLGSLRGQMVGQFLTESTLYSLAAVLLSMIACYTLMPYFNTLSGKTLGMDTLMQPAFLMGIVGLIFFVGLVAGSYPAFYMTSFSAVEVLKGKVRAGMKSKGVRSSLVVFQFAISIFLIICTVLVYQQLGFMQSRDMGFDKQNVMIIQNASRLDKNSDAFKKTLDQMPGILKTSYTNNSFPGINNTTIFKSAGVDEDHIMGTYYADYDHQDVMQFELKEGRYFSRDFPSDSTAILINEAAAKEFGFTDPLNEELLYNYEQGGSVHLRIIGVVKDFNFESLKEHVRPLSIQLGKQSNLLMVRYEGNASDMISRVGDVWKEQSSGDPFEYQFLDENFDELFRSEQRMSRLFTVFSGLAIFVACLGLFALSAFTSEQRTKEIGIRKTMGASVGNLTLLLSREFTVLVLIAFVPGALLAWWAMDVWLSSFAYRVPISPLIFMASGVAAIFIAWITVSFQSIRAASANPINALKYE